ncbi:hypothetical protein QBC39DRAFT_408947 [Podospora conica]|nr:hypothetical protein QBC39DRAFT_408947 [Schizothecium conicum]
MPSIKFLSLIALAGSAIATPVLLDSPIPGYVVEDLNWEIEVTPGQPLVQARGTVEEVIARMTQIDPDFEAKVLRRAEEATTLAERSPLVLEARQTSTNCEGRREWEKARTVRINDGIKYLKGLGGSAHLGAGPGRCSRVSCSYNAAIWWCNDNTGEKRINWSLLATAAERVVSRCETCHTANNAPECLVKGQAFYADNWNVIVRGDSC